MKQLQLQKKYNCSPRTTVLLPILVYFPVFIGATVSIREAAIRAAQFKAHVLNSAMDTKTPLIEAASLPGLEGLEGSERIETAKHLLTLSNEKLFDTLSLIEPDPNLILPIAVGVALSLNVELSASVRAAFVAAKQAQAASDAAESPPDVKTSPQARGKRTYATQPSKDAAPSREIASTALAKSSSIITNVLRVLSVAMIMVAVQNPVVRLPSHLATTLSENASRPSISTGSSPMPLPSPRIPSLPFWIGGSSYQVAARG